MRSSWPVGRFTDSSTDRHTQPEESPHNDPTIKPAFMVESLHDWHHWTLFLFNRPICEQLMKWVFYRLSKHHTGKGQSQKIILVRLNETTVGFQSTCSSKKLWLQEQTKKKSRHSEARTLDEPGLIPLIYNHFSLLGERLYRTCYAHHTSSVPQRLYKASTGLKSECKWFLHSSLGGWRLLPGGDNCDSIS